MSGSDLTGADLKEVDLFSTKLEKIVLKFADLTDSYLSEANLKGRVLTGRG
ncbi:pentapeptide repeat-containing protein [Cyanobacteria bacterium FACHB-472]|nr:pentapeptide repeat-containing protein [Cyanobacteria bacterium FACHB-472]